MRLYLVFSRQININGALSLSSNWFYKKILSWKAILNDGELTKLFFGAHHHSQEFNNMIIPSKNSSSIEKVFFSSGNSTHNGLGKNTKTSKTWESLIIDIIMCNWNLNATEEGEHFQSFISLYVWSVMITTKKLLLSEQFATGDSYLTIGVPVSEAW